MRQPNNALFVVLAFLSSTIIATAKPAVVESTLNLRAGPGPGYAVLAVMPPGAAVDVRDCYDGWCHVTYGGLRGYASHGYLEIGAVPPPAAVPPAVVESLPEISSPPDTEPRIWRWDDPDWRDDHWGDLQRQRRRR
jgi:uncharacterized protein YraI